MSNIKINPALKLISGTILEPELPTADSIKDAIFGLFLSDENHVEVIQSLVQAYVALLVEEDEDDEGFDLADDPETIYREFAVKAWRESVSVSYPGATKSRTDEDVYENCDWYEFDKVIWPTQLIAEVGYLVGYKSGRESVALSRAYEAMKGANA